MADTHNQPPRRAVKEAQQRHLNSLFGDRADAPAAPPVQQAQDHARARAADLEQAAAQKRRSLDETERQKLEELTASQVAVRQAAQPAPAVPPPPAQPQTSQTPTPASPVSNPAPSAPDSDLYELSRRNELASAALENMKNHLPPAANAPSTPPVSPPARAATPTPTARPTTPPAASPAQPSAQPSSEPEAPVLPRPRPPRANAPTPEELDRLLRAMAQRATRPAPRPGGGAGPERAEAAPVVEAPPAPPEESPEKRQEQQAEILRELQSREAQAQQQAAPVPQADDQIAAKEASIEATVPIETSGNAVRSAPLHAAIAALQEEMRVHSADGQVNGVNTIQENMPHHPLWKGNRPS